MPEATQTAVIVPVASAEAIRTGRRCSRKFGDDVLWPAPDRDQEFRDLTERAVEQFPLSLPYGGAHDDVVSHLTVGRVPAGHGRSGCH